MALPAGIHTDEDQLDALTDRLAERLVGRREGEGDHDVLDALADRLLEKLTERGVPDGTLLLDIMRAQKQCEDVQRLLRRIADQIIGEPDLLP